MVQESTPARWPISVAMCFLACLVAAVFHPIGDYEFINLDVPGQVANNPAVRGLSAENIKRIFDPTDPSSWRVASYYPIRTLSYAIDYQIWGEQPGGFKLTNRLIHLANVWLVFALVWRLFRYPNKEETFHGRWWGAWAAALGAGIFAVHPVVVEPVTWVAGREELLMVLGVLGCLHFHVTARGLAEEGAGGRKVLAFHAGAAAACALACLSNAVAAVIPLLVTAWDLLMVRPLRWRRIVWGTSALWVMGAATIVLKKIGGAAHPHVPEFGVFTVERLMMVLNIYWLNIKMLFWPSRLAIDYWNVAPASFTEPEVILGAVALVLTCLVLWLVRRRPRILFGLLWFGLALGPTANIMPHHLDRADRFLYLPLVGLVVAGALRLRPPGNALPRRAAAMAVMGVGTLGLLLVAGRSVVQVRCWRDSIAVWRNCVEVDPENALAYLCLAESLADDGRFAEGIPYYRESLRIDPYDPETLSKLAFRLATCRQHEFRDYIWAIRLAREACRLSNWEEDPIRRILSTAYMNYATAQKIDGQFDLAIENYRKAAETDPSHEVPLFNLASLLASCRDERLRQPDEAVELAERACELLGEPEPFQWAVLAEIYAQTGRLEEAVDTTEKAIRKAQAGDDSETAGQLRIRLQGYQDQIRPQSAGGHASPSD